MQYQVIDAKGAGILVDLVNVAIKDGWKPIGGVSVSTSTDQGNTREVYAQALIKE